MKSQYPVLMYHAIHDSDAEPGRYDSVYSVTHQEFSDQLDWLQTNGYKACTLAEAEQLAKTEKVVVITFDDGDVTNALFGLPELVKRNMLAEFYITTDWIDNEYSMSPAQLRELAAAGMEVHSHGKTHQYLSDLDDEELTLELTHSKTVLEDILGKSISTIALPGGRGDQRVQNIARQSGYTRLCTSVLGYNTSRSNPLALNRIAITNHMSMAAFSSLVSADGQQMRKLKIRQFILTTMKKLLGNTMYEQVRLRFLGR